MDYGECLRPLGRAVRISPSILDTSESLEILLLVVYRESPLL